MLEAGTANTPVRLHGGPFATQMSGSLSSLYQQNTILVSPFSPPGFCWGNRLSVSVLGAYSGAHVRVGLYQDNGDLYPGRKLFDSGAINPGSSGYYDVSTANWGFQPDKIYWSAIWQYQASGAAYLSGGMPILPMAHHGNVFPTGQEDLSPYCFFGGYEYPLVWDAAVSLPDPFPEGAIPSFRAFSVEFILRTV